MRLEFDVIIVGAGPAGSTAAILLARAGWSVALVEKQRFPRRKVCGECIAASNLPLFDALGIGELFEKSAGPKLQRVAFVQGKDTLVSDLPSLTHAKHEWGRALGRETLDTLLINQAAAAGATILQPWTARSLEGGTGNYRCEVRSAVTRETAILRAPVAIAAYGSWEPLPSADIPAGRRPHSHHLLAFKANFRGANLEPGILPVISFRGGYGGMVLADHGLLTVACCVRVDRLKGLRCEAPGIPAGAVVGATLLRECSAVATVRRNAHREGPWLAAGPLNTGIHLNPDDGIFRIGNAAGEAHPIIGEGISMAIQSAWVLSKHLLSAGPQLVHPWGTSMQREIGNLYAADWRRFFSRRLRLAAMFAHIAMRPRVFAPLLALMRLSSPLLKFAAQCSDKARAVVDPAIMPWSAITAPRGGLRNSGSRAISVDHHLL